VTTRRSVDDHPLDNAVWQALSTQQAAWAEVNGRARRFPTDVSVFAGVDVLDDEGWNDLLVLVGPSTGLALFRASIPDPPAGWKVHLRGRGHQMTVTAAALADSAPGSDALILRRLTLEDVGEA
jgi:hypothetical protein